MNRQQLIVRAKAILAEAYEEAAYMVAEYLDKHPSEKRQTLCKEVDPDNWSALDARVRRAETRKASVDTGTKPTSTVFDEHGGAAKRHAKRVLHQATPEQISKLLDTRDARVNVSKALDLLYTKRAKQAATARHERKAEDHGGEDALADHERGQRLAEIINVTRGAVSALRFAASQAKDHNLATDDSGAADELAGLVDEVLGFGSMLKEYLAGRAITDEDIAELIGEGR